MADEPLFKSFFLAGFECATHRRRDGRRLDLLAATGHDRLAASDYRTVAGLGLRTIRDGFRWHLIEQAPGVYDWSSVLPMLRAAQEADVQVIWDLCHFGWPDGLDIWSPHFVDRFARFSAAAAKLVSAESDSVPFFCAINEMSFLAWAGGDVAAINPCARQRGRPLKEQLVRASVAAVDAIRAEQPASRFLLAEPAIHIQSYSRRAAVRRTAELYRLAQFEALDMMAGRVAPELGGREDLVDIVGLNYYPRNQWLHRGSTLPLGHHGYRPFSEILQEVFARYHRPIVIAETGSERSARSSWLHYVCSEVRRALAGGVPVEGICLYPVLDYPGWDDDRLCETGLLTMPDALGERALHADFAEELAHQQARFDGMQPGRSRRK